MDYKQLKEMPRFYIEYSIKFFDKINNEKNIFCLKSCKKNDDILYEILDEEDETYSLNLKFRDFLFCGFSCSDAIIHLFSDDILKKIKCILDHNKSNIKDISLNIECYENKMAKRYYMNTDIVGKASSIIQIIKPNIYFSIGKDGIYTISELKKTCKYFFDIDIYQYKNFNDLLEKLKLLKKEYLIDKNNNFKKIIMAKYCIIFIKKFILKKKEF